jgi:cell division protein FtsB
LIALGIFAAVKLQLQQNEIEAEIAESERLLAEKQEALDEKKQRLDAPFDDDYVAEIAKEKLGLVFPEEIIYDIDLTEKK